MRNRKLVGSLLMLLALPVLANAQLPGKYTDGQFTAEFADAASGSFTGTLTLGGHQYPATAHASATGFDGTFTASSANFNFSAILDGDSLNLTTGGKTYSLKRQGGAANPLGAAAPANPLAGGDASNDAPAGYTVLASTDAGKSLLAQKPGITSIQAALQATFPELTKYFGNRPEIGKAFQDAHDSKSGGATFSTTWNQKPVKGFVSCKLINSGATVAVLFVRADASKADWEKLAAPSAVSPAADDSAKLLGADATTYRFPDGTGTLTLPAGWKTQAPSAISPIFITGPANQTVALGAILNVQTPDSPLVKMIAQNKAYAQRMGFRPPPAPPMLVARFTDPVQAMTDLGPQLSKLSEAQDGTSYKLDKILSQKEATGFAENAKAAMVSYLVNKSQKGKTTSIQALENIQIAPVGTGAWMYCVTGYSGPAATFDHDQPVMEAIIKSENVDQEVAAQRRREQNQQQMAMIQQQADANARTHDQLMQAQNDRFAAGQAAHAQQMAGYQAHNDQWKADELQKSRNNDDFVETIRGTRTVYDTQTGTSGTADLNYAGSVVDQLNTAAADPNRFVQIPLRDENDPLPGK